MTTHAAQFPESTTQVVIEIALDEDLGPARALDVTTLATIPADQVTTAHVVARAPGVIAGVPAIGMVLDAVTARLGGDAVTVTIGVDDGAVVTRGDVIATLTGPTRTILIAERTLLNLLSRVSGVATHTRLWMEALRGTGCIVLDTRKTTPGLRALEKYAVRAGGGRNKRMGLFDVAMIKDNHKLAAGSITAALERVRTEFPDVAVEVEVTTEAEAVEAVEAGARFLLLDNFAPEELAGVVRTIRRMSERVELEATGGLTLEVAREFAMTGVDYLSVGGLTHSSPILDIALDIVAS
ncbi:MAG: carboxylating nicotinate-nucleotide diphosphorylase [Intrasporangiaceae bacterium]|nr:carboxylating nicotinate-nucleotide diphosphorylase [Intrasporangiaceae bacterium]